MSKENGIYKIEKWLKEKGYSVKYRGFQYYRYTDNFHIKDVFYAMSVYHVSNGLYIQCKDSGKPRYYLCEDLSTHPLVIDFSQAHFLYQISQYFPSQKEGD